MPGRVVLCGDVTSRYEAERLLAELHPDVSVESVEKAWELVDRAAGTNADVAVFLRGPIAAHEERVAAVSSLRQRGFTGRILVAGAFLTEREEAAKAGADYVFDPDRQRTEEVVSAALRRPSVAADHPYLRALFVGEWCTLAPYDRELPAAMPDVLLVATSCHGDPGFYRELAAAFARRGATEFVLVDDGGSEEAGIEALSSGVQPVVVLAAEGTQTVRRLALAALRASWLRSVRAA